MRLQNVKTVRNENNLEHEKWLHSISVWDEENSSNYVFVDICCQWTFHRLDDWYSLIEIEEQESISSIFLCYRKSIFETVSTMNSIEHGGKNVSAAL